MVSYASVNRIGYLQHEKKTMGRNHKFYFTIIKCGMQQVLLYKAP
jgi:hypothetical protein